MNEALSKHASSVQIVLNKANLACKVLELPSSTRTANEAALSIGCNVAQIVKSLIFKTENTHKPVLFLVSGINKVNEQKMETYLAEKIVKADAHFTKEITGFAIGGIPPIGHKHIIDMIYIDQTLLLHDEVWAAAGTSNAVFCIKSTDLVQITAGKVIILSN